MEILFLDIDGVLNNHQYRQRQSEKNDRFTITEAVCDKHLEKLQKLFNSREKLHSVVTSTHRIRNDISLLKENLSGLRVISKTPEANLERKRGELINKWLESHESVESWAILDDNTKEMLESQIPKTVSPGTHAGLKSRHVDELDKVLDEGYSK